MKTGDKVIFKGRYDYSQKPDAIILAGEVIKITPKRIFVRETNCTVFVFKKDTKMCVDGVWKLSKRK